MTRFFKRLLSLTLLISITACSDGQSSDKDITPQGLQLTLSQNNVFQVLLTWPGELKAGSHLNAVHVTIMDKDGKTPPEDAAIALKAFHVLMPGMGHGASEEHLEIESHGDENNHFEVTGIQFSMAGAEGSWVAALTVDYNGTVDVGTVKLPKVL